MIQLLQDEVLAHRYLYYVICRPVISDAEYDEMDRAALRDAPEGSPLRSPGSDCEDHYPQEIRDLAASFQK